MRGSFIVRTFYALKVEETPSENQQGEEGRDERNSLEETATPSAERRSQETEAEENAEEERTD